MNYTNRLEEDETGMAQESWKRMVEETGLDKLVLDKSIIIVLRQYHQLAYLQGRKDMLEQIQELYDEDIDLMMTVFEREVKFN